MAAPDFSLTHTVELNSGAKMPTFGLGTWRSEPSKVATAVELALKHGYRHIDAAHIYQNQDEVAQGLEAAYAAGVNREDIWITSKIWNNCHHPDSVRPAVEEILKQLRVAYVDLILIHWPTAFQAGPLFFPPHGNSFPADVGSGIDADAETKLTDTWAALEACVDAGLVRNIGVSNHTTAEVDQILAACRIRPAVNQVECHPYFNQAALRADMSARGIAVTAYSPLGNVAPPPKPSCLDDETIKAVAAKHGKSPAQVMVRWSLQLGNIVIPKTVTPARIPENAAVFDFALDADDMAKIGALGERRLRMINPPFRPGAAQVFSE